MGGGDLNSKKSWHPNTMKNQERVWKAEQVAAEEKKRILELQRECAEKKEHAELNKMAKQLSGTNVDDDRLHWMYDKPDKKAKDEDYLLGKAIDSDKNEKSESDIPAVARRVVGSSMLTTAGDIQVDLARKMREDPLLLVKERERAARAALLNNPIHRRRIAELLRTEQEQKEKKAKKKSKKKDIKKDKEKDLDKMLASKLSALGNDKVDLASLLASSDSSSDEVSSEDIKLKKKKKQKRNKKSKTSDKDQKSRNRDTQSSDDEDISKRQAYQENSKKHGTSEKQNKAKERKCKSSSDVSQNEIKARKRKSDDNFEESKTDQKRTHYDLFDKRHKSERNDYRSSRSEIHDKPKKIKDRRSSSSSREYKRRRDKSSELSHYQQEHKSKSLSKEEKEARLRAMVEAGAEREKERGRRVAEQRAADAAAEKVSRGPRVGRSEAHALPESLESRIHSNRHYIQRDKRHMDEHFARR